METIALHINVLHIIKNNSRNFLALVKDGSLEPYLKKEEVEKNESNQEEEVKKGDVKVEL